MKCFAVIDTNVLVSALLSKNEDAATVQVLSKMFLSAFTSLFSDEILSEYSQVLKRKKISFFRAFGKSTDKRNRKNRPKGISCLYRRSIA